MNRSPQAAHRRFAGLELCLCLAFLATTGKATPTRYRVGEGSEVLFKAASNLHGFHGGTKAVTGMVTYDPAAPMESLGEVVINPQELRSGDRKRDDGMRRDALEVSKYPEIKIVMRRFVPDKELAEGGAPGEVTGNIHGRLELHGMSRNLLVPARIETSLDGSLRVRGVVGFDMTDWGIRPPRARKFLVTISVLPNVSVSFDLKLEPETALAADAGLLDPEETNAAAERLRAMADKLRARQ